MPFQKYIDDIHKRYKTSTAREHTYRPALQNLLEDVIPDILASNDPARIECGAPDFILSRRNIDVGYIEAKDIGDGLDRTEKTEQLKRYRESLENLILTDYLEFRFFLRGEKVEAIRIGEETHLTLRGAARPTDRRRLRRRAGDGDGHLLTGLTDQCKASTAPDPDEKCSHAILLT